MDHVRKFLGDEQGATAIEYGLIACFIFVAIVASVGVLGGSLATAYTRIGNMF